MIRFIMALTLCAAVYTGLHSYTFGRIGQMMPFFRAAGNGQTFGVMTHTFGQAEMSYYTGPKDDLHEWNIKFAGGGNLLQAAAFTVGFQAYAELITDTARVDYWFCPRTIFWDIMVLGGWQFTEEAVLFGGDFHICRHEVDMLQVRSRIFDAAFLGVEFLPRALAAFGPGRLMVSGLADIVYPWSYAGGMGYRFWSDLSARAAYEMEHMDIYFNGTLTPIYQAAVYPYLFMIGDTVPLCQYRWLLDYTFELGITFKGKGGGLSIFARYEYLNDSMMEAVIKNVTLLSMGVSYKN